MENKKIIHNIKVKLKYLSKDIDKLEIALEGEGTQNG